MSEEKDPRQVATTPEGPVLLADTLRVVRNGGGQAARLYIDGELFPWATDDGFTVNPRRGEGTYVMLKLVGRRVEVTDEAWPVKNQPEGELGDCPAHPGEKGDH